MKILLTSLNSKFIHTNLAIRYFEAVLSPVIECEVIEHTINQRVEKITDDILKKEFDLLAFSAYIWNIEESLKVASVIKKARPEVKIIFGGPEVSYDVRDFLEDNNFIDFLLSGEGEESIFELIKALQSNGDLDIRGLS
ncbi:MAG: B12-binding domain-containing radical SAM protein, partial [Tissierellia bacterium]|nr:B12-binding domain-containing radical SAM protein [Tissierellia bacterium]